MKSLLFCAISIERRRSKPKKTKNIDIQAVQARLFRCNLVHKIAHQNENSRKMFTRKCVLLSSAELHQKGFPSPIDLLNATLYDAQRLTINIFIAHINIASFALVMKIGFSYLQVFMTFRAFAAKTSNNIKVFNAIDFSVFKFQLCSLLLTALPCYSYTGL